MADTFPWQHGVLNLIKFVNSFWYTEGLCHSSFFGYFDGLEKSMFQDLKENLHIDFSLFLKIKSSDMFV